ncbi:membrane dipeptidase [Sphingopyxis sp. OAS728]|uniref:dipeptidase n=1 Tax=Sphingopyxis sp. OAS728 TaxID=2663823 RepID=UPI0019E09E25|nr:membrane dipeptidase [Sphingopyxis sp. OAS728]MBE1529276.1 membrane dipeptidase [Sphingopyxis sp. OAS728]
MMLFSRRQAICAAGAAIAVPLAAPYVARAQVRISPFTNRAYSKRAIELVQRAVVVDMLAPIKIDFDPSYYTKALSEKETADFRASGINAIHHAVGIGGPTAKEQALSFFAIWGNFVARNSHVFTGVDKFADILRAKKDGKVAVIMGLQNADHFNRPADVKTFYEIGQRCAQLTYNSQNRIGSGSTDRVDGGVSDFGVEIIKAMNEVGMLVDVSHCGDRTTLDAIEISAKPIAITHSNCRALIDHPRVKTDEAIKACAAKGGVMGITGVRNFVSKTDPTTIVNYADHIDHVVKLVGIDHVGVGTDSDLYGYDDTSPEMNKMLRGAYKDSYAFREKIDIDGFDHPLKMFDLTEELLRRKYSDANILAVLGGNFQRLLTATWGG